MLHIFITFNHDCGQENKRCNPTVQYNKAERKIFLI